MIGFDRLCYEKVRELRWAEDVKVLAPAQGCVYARIGLKIAGVEDMTYIPVPKLDLK